MQAMHMQAMQQCRPERASTLAAIHAALTGNPWLPTPGPA